MRPNANREEGSLKKTEQRDGSFRFHASDVSEANRRSLQDFALIYCGICDVQPFRGTVSEGQAWFRAHQLEAHPERRDRGQTARRRAAGQVRPGASV